MKNSSLKAVLWDMDGVIADTGSYHFRAWQYAFRQHGIIFNEQDFKNVFGQRNDTIVRKTLGMDLPQVQVNSILDVKEKHFRQIVQQHLKSFPGVINLLGLLKEENIASAIASSAPIENILLVLNSLAIKDYFQAIVYGQEVSEGKPSPKIFLLAAQKLSAEPYNCIVIEDSIAGVTGAKRAGMRCVAVTNSHSKAELAEADMVVDSLMKVNLIDLESLFKPANNKF
jgi:beta-phosphoglucomutase family hydrolase